MWETIAKALSALVPQIIRSYLVPTLLGAVGLAGGIWTWIAGFALNKAWKAADKEIESEARTEDQKIKDEALLIQYKEDIKDGKPEQKLIDDEVSILNGGRKP